MGYLHELLAVEKDRKKTALRILVETGRTLSSKATHFGGKSRVYEPFNDDDETFDSEIQEVVTSVPEKLSFFNKSQIKFFDTILQKEKTNSKATADIVINVEDGDNIIIAENVPVQAIVQIENHLQLIREKVYNIIPTLDPKLLWISDTAKGKFYYRTNPIKKRKTKKVEDIRVIVPPTDRHPAQTHAFVVDKQVGNWVETNFSGMISPVEKSDLLEKVETMIEAVKKARARANKIETEKGMIGKKIFDYISNP